MLTLGIVDEASIILFGLEGRRPLRPLRLSVRTTIRQKRRRYMRPVVYPSLKRTSAYYFEFSLLHRKSGSTCL